MRILKLFLLALALSACSKPTENLLTVGTIAGPETALVEAAKREAEEKYGLTVRIVEFTDYQLPNEALADGSLDANVFQHEPYLKSAAKIRQYAFEVLGKTFVYPMGIYSSKLNSLSDLRTNATIAIPNDPTNEARALLLLKKAGLITLKDNPFATINDIESNPKALTFKELDAAQLPRILPDVDAAVINTNYAIPAGLSPSHDALFLEGPDSLYANLIVIRKNTSKAKRKSLRLFVQCMHSDAVKREAKKQFGDGAIPAWEKP